MSGSDETSKEIWKLRWNINNLEKKLVIPIILAIPMDETKFEKKNLGSQELRD